MTHTETQYSALYCLWEVYLHMRAWCAPEHEQLRSVARGQFTELVRTGALFTYVEDCKRDVLRSGIDAPDGWLAVLCASRVVAGETLPQAERDQLGVILNEIYLALVRLDPDAHPREDAGLDDDEPPATSMNDAVRRAGESLEWVQRERPELAPGPTTRSGTPGSSMSTSASTAGRPIPSMSTIDRRCRCGRPGRGMSASISG